MEADWEVEIGGEAAVIEADWEGFIDLGRSPTSVDELSETRAFPPLGRALLQLNEASSPVWSSKCDFWPRLKMEELDPFEIAATHEELSAAAGLYIDILPKIPWEMLSSAEQACRSLCVRLHVLAFSCCRVDLIVRQAWTKIDATAPTLGLTAYLTACGATENSALDNLTGCLQRLTQTVLETLPGQVQTADSTLQSKTHPAPRTADKSR